MLTKSTSRTTTARTKAAITAEQLLFTEKHYECINGRKGKSNERLKKKEDRERARE